MDNTVKVWDAISKMLPSDKEVAAFKGDMVQKTAS